MVGEDPARDAEIEGAPVGVAEDVRGRLRRRVWAHRPQGGPLVVDKFGSRIPAEHFDRRRLIEHGLGTGAAHSLEQGCDGSCVRLPGLSRLAVRHPDAGLPGQVEQLGRAHGRDEVGDGVRIDEVELVDGQPLAAREARQVGRPGDLSNGRVNGAPLTEQALDEVEAVLAGRPSDQGDPASRRFGRRPGRHAGAGAATRCRAGSSPASRRSASTMIRISSPKPVRGRQPRTRSAFEASPRSSSTSVGRR